MATLPESPDTTAQPVDELRARLERLGSWDALGTEVTVSVDSVIDEVRAWLETQRDEAIAQRDHAHRACRAEEEVARLRTAVKHVVDLYVHGGDTAPAVAGLRKVLEDGT